METYALAKVGWVGGAAEVQLTCSHQQDAQALLSQLQEAVPFHVKPRSDWSMNGDEFAWAVSRCKGKHNYVYEWCQRWLCLHGWEPFATGSELVVLFRKRLEK